MQAMRNFFYQKDSLQMRLTAIAVVVLLLGALLTQVVFAENTYVITDGDRVLVHTTSSTDPVLVLNEAGFELGKDDTYTTQPGLGVSEITVKRMQNITVAVGGRVIKAEGYGETVGELLGRLNISVGDGVTVSASLKDMTFDGMTIFVNGSEAVTEVYVQEIPYEITYCTDPSLPTGQEQVLTDGKVGQLQVTAKVTYVNGEETSRMVEEEKVLTAPVNALVAIGSAPVAPTFDAESVIGEDYIITATGEVLHYTSVRTMEATAYTCEGYVGITATGTIARVGAVAVDPKVIPYGTRMFIVSEDGQYIYGIATAEDCGGAIQGNIIDLYMDTEAECWQFGRRNITVYILG